MSMKSLVSPDAFIFIPDSLSRISSSNNLTIIFFITGNPGLIGYYHTFLSLLSEIPSDEISSGPGFDTSQCVIAGFSLGGFELHEPKPLHSLQDQISLTFSRIRDLATSLHQVSSGELTRSPRVILIGHSVGAFIALEVVQIWHETWGFASTAAPDMLSPDSHEVEQEPAHKEEQVPPYEIAGAILLTPTIFDIAKSSSGRVAAPLLTYIPFFPRLVQVLASSLSWALSKSQLRWLVARVTGMLDPALGTTEAFLRSPAGVRQALGMAGDEMREITRDRWGPEVWGVEQDTCSDGLDTTVVDAETESMPSGKAPKLIFYFAAKDHWVADATREEILKARGSKNGGTAPTMVVEEEGKLVHGWCISQSGFVAEKVREWVREILVERI